MNTEKNIQVKLTKSLLDIIILQLLDNHSMHSYQIITKIRKNFGICLDVSIIYPMLKRMEKESYIKSEWNMDSDRPRKFYSLTSNGKNMLNFNEESINLICRKITAQTNTEYDS